MRCLAANALPPAWPPHRDYQEVLLPTDTIQQRKTIHRQLQDNQTHIKDLEQQIKATQKLASLGTMACLIAHEFNNLLAPMITYSELALKNPHDVPLAHKALQKNVKNAQRAALIVRSMLGMVREHLEDDEPADLATIVHECFQCLARDFTKDGISVKLDIPEDLVPAIASNQLQQVLLNLIINARQAMLHRGGMLTIRGRLPEQRTVEITVADTGCGIEPDTIDHIFEAFFSTKTQATRPEEQGTGLGLSVCQNIVEAHHGQITVDSQLGSSTTFTILLPANPL